MGQMLPLQGDPRQLIANLWPQHLAHLSPPGNTMGGGKIDPDEGVICNCGEVLGFPAVQDEADYVTEEPDQPDTSGAQTGEPDDEDATVYQERHGNEPTDEPDEEPEPDWTEQQTAREHAPDPDNYQDPDMLEDLEEQSAPGPLAQSVQDKASTVDAIWNHPDTQAVVAETLRDAEMRDRFAANPHDAEARAYVHSQYEQSQVGQEGVDGDSPGPLTAPGDEAQADSPYLAAAWAEIANMPNPVLDAYNASQGAPPDSHDTSSEYHEDDWRAAGALPERPHDVVSAEDPIASRVTIIDPSYPYGPKEVEEQLLDVASRIERGMHAQRYWEERAHNATLAHTFAWARSVSKASGAADVRKATAILECAELYAEMELCNTMVRCLRETMHNLRSLQTGYQTVARSVGQSMQNPAGHQPGNRY